MAVQKSKKSKSKKNKLKIAKIDDLIAYRIKKEKIFIC